MRDTIKNHYEFIMGEGDPAARSAFFLVRMRPTIFKTARYGLVATKKTFRLAVDRNRARRLMRDWIRYNEKMMRRDADYIFIARRAILGASRVDGRTAMKKALHFLRRGGFSVGCDAVRADGDK